MIVHVSDEPVASLGQGLQKSRLIGVIRKRASNLPDGVIQALLKIYKGLGPPDLLRQFLARYYLPGAPD